MQGLVVPGLIFLAGLIYFIWTRVERRRHAAHEAVAHDVASLGDDLVPTSIHPVVDPNRCIGSGACIAACPEDRVIGIVNGQASLINPLSCIGHGACQKACPVQAITLVFGTTTRGVELPALDQHFETNQPGVYVVGELGGMGLIRNAVEQGKQAARAIAATGRRGRGDGLDAIVVGAGPAGISATLQLLDEGLRVELLEENVFGGTISHYPRAKVVMTGVLEIPRYGKVKSRTMSKEDLVSLWGDIRTRMQLPVSEGERVEALDREPGGAWLVRSSGGVRRAANVVLALGRRGAPRRLGVPGEELAKVSYRLLEPAELTGRHVLVVGGGNSAAETAIALADAGVCASIALSYRRAELARLRASVRDAFERHVAAGRVRRLMPTIVTGIAESSVSLEAADGRALEIANDAVIVQIGGTSPVDLLATFGIRTVEKRAEI